MNEMLLEQNAQYRQNSRQTPIQPITVHPVPGIQQPGIQQSPVCVYFNLYVEIFIYF